VGAPAAPSRLRCRVPVSVQALSPISDSQRPGLEAFLLPPNFAQSLARDRDCFRNEVLINKKSPADCSNSRQGEGREPGSFTTDTSLETHASTLF